MTSIIDVADFNRMSIGLFKNTIDGLIKNGNDLFDIQIKFGLIKTPLIVHLIECDFNNELIFVSQFINPELCDSFTFNQISLKQYFKQIEPNIIHSIFEHACCSNKIGFLNWYFEIVQGILLTDSFDFVRQITCSELRARYNSRISQNIHDSASITQEDCPRCVVCLEERSMHPEFLREIYVGRCVCHNGMVFNCSHNDQICFGCMEELIHEGQDCPLCRAESIINLPCPDLAPTRNEITLLNAINEIIEDIQEREPEVNLIEVLPNNIINNQNINNIINNIVNVNRNINPNRYYNIDTENDTDRDISG